MAHFITDKCTGCTMCIRVCPTGAITGDKKDIHLIEPTLCIDCSTCGIYCPYDAIEDGLGVIVPRIKPKDIPKAFVIEESCSGCVFCVEACPFDCITMVENPRGGDFFQVAVVDQDKCVSCKLCAQVCIKDAIVVDRPLPYQHQSYGSFQKPEEHLVPEIEKVKQELAA
ncbi:MAG: 4Fe-4S binding protein [Bdellovibrionota bacterium]